MVLPEISPVLQTSLTIALSAIAGAIAIIIARGVYERRRLLAALHAELVDNFLELESKNKSIGEDPDRDAINLLSGTYSRAAFDAIKVNDPVLYLNLDSYSKNLRMVYGMIGTWEKLNQNPPLKLSVETPIQGQQNSSQKGQKKDNKNKNLSETVDNTYKHTFNTIKDIETYVSESLFRRVFYWRCLGYSPDELYDDNNE